MPLAATMQLGTDRRRFTFSSALELLTPVTGQRRKENLKINGGILLQSQYQIHWLISFVTEFVNFGFENKTSNHETSFI